MESVSLPFLGLTIWPTEDLSNASRIAQPGTPSLLRGILWTPNDVGPSLSHHFFLSALIVIMMPYISATSTCSRASRWTQGAPWLHRLGYCAFQAAGSTRPNLWTPYLKFILESVTQEQ